MSVFTVAAGGPDRLRVIDAVGAHLFWTDEPGAQDLIRRKLVRLVRRGGRARLLQVRADAPAAAVLELAGRGSGFHALRTVHRRETEDNPPRVWCLLHPWQLLAIAR